MLHISPTKELIKARRIKQEEEEPKLVIDLDVSGNPTFN